MYAFQKIRPRCCICGFEVRNLAAAAEKHPVHAQCSPQLIERERAAAIMAARGALRAKKIKLGKVPAGYKICRSPECMELSPVRCKVCRKCAHEFASNWSGSISDL